MATPLENRQPNEQRSLATLDRDFSKFEEAGSDMRKAKLHNNVIRHYLFDIPLNQVKWHLPGGGNTAIYTVGY